MAAPAPSPAGRVVLWAWLLPLLWALVVAGARRYRGDEYGMFLVATLPALPFAWLVPGADGFLSSWITATACGLLWLVPLAWTMNSARVRPLPWALLWLGLALLVAALWVASYPSIARAVAKNGSLWAYVFAGLGLALVPASVGSLFLPGFRAPRLAATEPV